MSDTSVTKDAKAIRLTWTAEDDAQSGGNKACPIIVGTAGDQPGYPITMSDTCGDISMTVQQARQCADYLKRAADAMEKTSNPKEPPS